MDPDLELIKAMAHGDAGALDALMGRHKDALHRFAWRYTGSDVDAAEVVQETFVRTWFHAERFRPKSTVRGWIFAIAANLCRDRARKARRWRTMPLETDDAHSGPVNRLPAHGPDAAAEAESAEQLDRLRAAVDRLPHKLKAPFVLCVLEDHSQQEVAAILGTSAKAVETRIRRARIQLRDAVDRGS